MAKSTGAHWILKFLLACDHRLQTHLHLSLTNHRPHQPRQKSRRLMVKIFKTRKIMKTRNERRRNQHRLVHMIFPLVVVYSWIIHAHTTPNRTSFLPGHPQQNRNGSYDKIGSSRMFWMCSCWFAIVRSTAQGLWFRFRVHEAANLRN